MNNFSLSDLSYSLSSTQKNESINALGNLQPNAELTETTSDRLQISPLPRSPREQLLETLIALGKLNPLGYCVNVGSWPKVDAFGESEVNRLLDFLNSPFTIFPTLSKAETSLSMLMNHLVRANRLWNKIERCYEVEDIFLVGSHLQEIEHSGDWAVNHLIKILEGNKVNQALIAEIKRKEASDSDWRFYPKGAKKEDKVRALSLEVVTFFTNNIYWTPSFQGRSAEDNLALKEQKNRQDYHHTELAKAPTEWLELRYNIERHGFSKFNYFNSERFRQGPKTAYTITAFQHSTSKPIELMFIDELERDCLFTLDDCKLNLRTVFESIQSGKSPIHLQITPQSKAGLWQHLIDQFCYILHIDKIQSVDNHGYIRMISHLTRGAKILEDDLEDLLLLKIQVQHTDDRSQKIDYEQFAHALSHLISEYILKHQIQDPQSISAIILNLLSSLKRLQRTGSFLQKVLDKLAPLVRVDCSDIFSQAIHLIGSKKFSFDCIHGLIHTLAFLNVLRAKSPDARRFFYLTRHAGGFSLEIHDKYHLITTGDIIKQLSLVVKEVNDVYPKLNPKDKEKFDQFLKQLIPVDPFLALDEDQNLKVAEDLKLDVQELEPLAKTLLEFENAPQLNLLGFQLYQTLILLNKSHNPQGLIASLPRVMHQMALGGSQEVILQNTVQALQGTLGHTLLESFHLTTKTASPLTEAFIAGQMIEHFISCLNPKNKDLVVAAWDSYPLSNELKARNIRPLLTRLAAFDLKIALRYFESLAQQLALEDTVASFTAVIDRLKNYPPYPLQDNSLEFLTKTARALIEKTKKQKQSPSQSLRSTPRQSPSQNPESFKESILWLIKELYKQGKHSSAESLSLLATTCSILTVASLKTPDMWIEICSTALNVHSQGIEIALFYFEKAAKAGIWKLKEMNLAFNDLLLQIIERLFENQSSLASNYLSFATKQTFNASQKNKLTELIARYVHQEGSTDHIKKRIDLFSGSLSKEQRIHLTLELIEKACQKKEFDQAFHLIQLFLVENEWTPFRERIIGLFENLLEQIFLAQQTNKGCGFLQHEVCHELYTKNNERKVKTFLRFYDQAPLASQPELLHTLLREATPALGSEEGLSIVSKTNTILDDLRKPLSHSIRATLTKTLPVLVEYCKKAKDATEGALLLLRAEYNKLLPDVNDRLIKDALSFSKELLESKKHEKVMLANRLLTTLKAFEILPRGVLSQQRIFLSLIDHLIEQKACTFAEEWIQKYSKVYQIENALVIGWISAFAEMDQFDRAVRLLELIQGPIELKFLANLLKRMRAKDAVLCSKILCTYKELLRNAPGLDKFIASLLEFLSEKQTQESVQASLNILQAFNVTSLTSWHKALQMAENGRHQPLYPQAAHLLTIIENSDEARKNIEKTSESFEVFLLLFNLLKDVKAHECLDIIHNFDFWENLFRDNFSESNQICLLQKLLIWGISIVPSYEEPHIPAEDLFRVRDRYALLWRKLFQEEPLSILEIDEIIISEMLRSNDLELCVGAVKQLEKVLREAAICSFSSASYVNEAMKLMASAIEAFSKFEEEKSASPLNRLEQVFLAFIYPNIGECDPEVLAAFCEGMLRHKFAYFHIQALLILIEFSQKARSNVTFSDSLKKVAETIILRIVNNMEAYIFVDYFNHERVLEDLLINATLPSQMGMLFSPLVSATICSKAAILKLKEALANFSPKKAQEAYDFFYIALINLRDYPDLEYPCMDLMLELILKIFTVDGNCAFLNFTVLKLLQAVTGSGNNVLSTCHELPSTIDPSYAPQGHDFSSPSAFHNRVMSKMIIDFLNANDLEQTGCEQDKPFMETSEKQNPYLIIDFFEPFSSLNFLLSTPKDRERLLRYIKLYIDKLFKVRSKNSALQQYILSQIEEYLRFLIEHYEERMDELAECLEKFIFHPSALNFELTVRHMKSIELILPTCKKLLEKKRDLALKIGPYVTLRPLGASKFIDIRVTIDEIVTHSNNLVEWMINEGESSHSILRALILVRNLQNSVSELKAHDPNAFMGSYRIHISYKILMDAILKDPFYITFWETEESNSEMIPLFHSFHLLFTDSFLFTFMPDSSNRKTESGVWKKMTSQISLNWLENLLTLSKHYGDSSEGLRLIVDTHSFLGFCLQHHVFHGQFKTYKTLLNDFIDRFNELLALVIEKRNLQLLESFLETFVFVSLFNHRTLSPEERRSLKDESDRLITILLAYENPLLTNYALKLLQEL